MATALLATIMPSSPAWRWFDGSPVMVIAQQKGRDTKQKLSPQFRHAEARRLSQGDAADGVGGEVLATDHYPAGHARAPIPASTPRSADKPRRSRRISARCRAWRTGDRGGDRRRRKRRCAGAGRRKPHLYDGERGLQRDLPRKLRRDHLSRFRQSPQAAAALKMTAPDLLEARPHRRHRARARRRRPHRSRQRRRSAGHGSARDAGGSSARSPGQLIDDATRNFGAWDRFSSTRRRRGKSRCWLGSSSFWR